MLVHYQPIHKWLITQYFILRKKYLLGEKVTLSYDSGWRGFIIWAHSSLQSRLSYPHRYGAFIPEKAPSDKIDWKL